MKANELRIGNWVLYENEYREIGHIMNDGRLGIVLKGCSRVIQRAYVYDEELQPIRLTEEILLKIKHITKFEFDNTHNPYISYSLNEVIDDSMVGIGFTDAKLIIFFIDGKYEVFDKEVEYLHELQNIAFYLLDKKELEINL